MPLIMYSIACIGYLSQIIVRLLKVTFIYFTQQAINSHEIMSNTHDVQLVDCRSVQRLMKVGEVVKYL